MKIIAEMGSSKYLLEVSRKELLELNPDIYPEIGAEYDTLKAANTLDSLRSLSRNKMFDVKEQLDLLQKSYREICDSYDEVMLLDTIANIKNNYD